jgi:2-(1,2-epoxy-1,2-dihydrophenyl)acetyl-CoA isomerase
MSESIRVETKEAIATIWLNKPKQYNAFDHEMVGALAEHLNKIAADESIRGVVITGEGKAFCAGGNLKAVSEYGPSLEAGFHGLATSFHIAAIEIRRMFKPVIAAVNGVAAGGGFSLALCCDFRVLAESAVLRQAYTSNGLCLDGGGTHTLPRMVGFARALEIAAFDKPISAEQALEWGLTTKIAQDGETVAEAKDMCRELAAGSLHSYGLSKQLLTDSFNTSFETQLEHERAGLKSCAAHPDGQEGIKAFLEKRKPLFAGTK